MELAKHVLVLGRCITEHHQLADGDIIFAPKPKARSAEESHELIRRATSDLQAYVTAHAVKFPCHERMQPLRLKVLAPVCVTAYVDMLTESYASIKSVSAIVSSLSPAGEAVSGDLSARATILRLLTIGVKQIRVSPYHST